MVFDESDKFVETRIDEDDEVEINYGVKSIDQENI